MSKSSQTIFGIPVIESDLGIQTSGEPILVYPFAYDEHGRQIHPTLNGDAEALYLRHFGNLNPPIEADYHLLSDLWQRKAKWEIVLVERKLRQKAECDG